MIPSSLLVCPIPCYAIGMPNRTIDKLMADRVDRLRRQANMTQQRYAAEVLHCSQGTASTKLAGKTRMSSSDVLNIAKAFNVSTDYIYGLSDSPEPGCQEGVTA
ncbi:helix-turn-helix transcriptional regulator [Bifidobacterium longum]|uniref:HTH cro/C1-type domain-containing protein n=3 Tax=Bifidobacterium longum TaxID=216816 RepID=A0A3D8TX91_BIFLN|nr:hypothetical protein CE169_09670 [Bifidobacterium longum]RGQ74015.1 XRE family transcriptional regulator [Bifidobacterium longum]RHC69404.1 XRE family transcriptional regulator [Bifidobacterium longum]